jgi:hypothetical protein
MQSLSYTVLGVCIPCPGSRMRTNFFITKLAVPAKAWRVFWTNLLLKNRFSQTANQWLRRSPRQTVFYPDTCCRDKKSMSVIKKFVPNTSYAAAFGALSHGRWLSALGWPDGGGHVEERGSGEVAAFAPGVERVAGLHRARGVRNHAGRAEVVVGRVDRFAGVGVDVVSITTAALPI